MLPSAALFVAAACVSDNDTQSRNINQSMRSAAKDKENGRGYAQTYLIIFWRNLGENASRLLLEGVLLIGLSRCHCKLGLLVIIS